jgi:hypothetical protein
MGRLSSGFWRILAFAGVKSQAQDRKGNHNLLGVAPAYQRLLKRANSNNPEVRAILAEMVCIS